MPVRFCSANLKINLLVELKEQIEICYVSVFVLRLKHSCYYNYDEQWYSEETVHRVMNTNSWI